MEKKKIVIDCRKPVGKVNHPFPSRMRTVDLTPKGEQGKKEVEEMIRKMREAGLIQGDQ